MSEQEEKKRGKYTCGKWERAEDAFGYAPSLP